MRITSGFDTYKVTYRTVDVAPPGESFDGPPSSAIFAGAGFVYVAPDYLGLGDSRVPRHRYLSAATEASSAADLLAASGRVLKRLRVRRDGELFTFGSPREATPPWPSSGRWSGGSR